MKRILYLIKTLDRGGAEQLLLETANLLDRSRFEFEIAYTARGMHALAKDIEDLGARVWCLKGGPGIGWAARLRAYVRAQRIDLVHAHSPYAAVGARIALLGRGRPRLVYTEHSIWESYRKPTYWANVLTFGRNDHVFAVSNHVSMSMRYPRGLRFLPMPPVETLYHGINPANVAEWTSSNGVRREFGIPADAPLIGTVANFTVHKGHRYLLEAAAQVVRHIPDARFLFVGVGPLQSQIREQASRLGLDETVVFTGRRADAPRIAGACDVFALSSIQEGLSVALIEAMALGRPVVVTNVGGLPEVVEDGKQGFLVSPSNPKALADAILLLLRDPALRERLGMEGRRRAESFNVREAVRRMEHVYDDLLARRA